MSSMDERVEMPHDIDNGLYMLLKPLFGDLTIAAMDLMWEAAVGMLATHAEAEAVSATREAVPDA